MLNNKPSTRRQNRTHQKRSLRRSVHYTDRAECCADCAHYSAPHPLTVRPGLMLVTKHSCSKNEFNVSPKGICDLWTEKVAAHTKEKP